MMDSLKYSSPLWKFTFYLGKVKLSEMIDEDIRRYRLQIIVHSVIYYTYSCNIISDEEWSKRAKKLVELQSKYPEIASKFLDADEINYCDASTGFQFANHPWGKLKAKQLLLHEYGQKFVPEGVW